MKKPTLLYASPFWPKKSGISEYSEALIIGLIKYFDITLIIDDYKIENKTIQESYKIIIYNQNENYGFYDYIIYNFGNNPYYHCYMYDMILKYPGYVILHDFVLYYLTIGYYEERNKLFQKIYELEGIRGVQIVKASLKENDTCDLLQHKKIASQLPMNREVLEKAKGVFVHSAYTENLINENYKNINTHKIHLVKCETIKSDDNKFLHRYYKLDEASFIIGAVGFIAETKQNELTCLAVKKYNESHVDKIHYVMIGEGNYVDHLLDPYIHKTGFFDNKEFFKAIYSCNLIMNLRYPYHGESSATLIQCMDLEIPCVVTNIGWFSELPNEIVIKQPIDVTVDNLEKLICQFKDKNYMNITKKALEYVKNNCLPEIVGFNIYNYMINH